MSIRYENLDDYNYALDVLEKYFNQQIKSSCDLKEMLELLNGSREYKTVTIRAIHQKFMTYRKKFEDYTTPTNEEKKMWEELLGIWQ